EDGGTLMSESADPLPVQPPQAEPPEPAASLGEQLCADLVRRWHRGERVPAEAYLMRHPQLGDEPAFELVLTEVVLRQEFGEPAPLEEFLGGFPRFADRLTRHFALPAPRAALPDEGQPAADAPPPTSSGAAPPPAGLPVVPGYEILGELGRGGM